MTQHPAFLLLAFEGFAWALAALLPALVALYFLKLRRERVLISSTLLWKRAVEDLRVNAPFQRLRRSLLLLLQLLALAGVVFAASRPVITGSETGGRSVLLLLDVSGSMGAREDGGTRLDLAKSAARSLAEGLIAGDRMALITFATRSRVVQPLTADKAALQRAIASVLPTALPTDLIQALRTAAALAEGTTGAEAVVIGDGAYGELSGLPPDLERLPVSFTCVGKSEGNLGIVEMDVRKSFGGRRGTELFASVKNASARDEKVSLGVYRGDRLVAAQELEIPAGKIGSRSFDASRLAGLEGPGPAVLRLEVSPGGALPADDVAWVRLPPPGRLSVLVVGGANPFLERVLAVQEGVDARRVSLPEYVDMARAGKLASDPAQVIIFDRAAPPGGPDRPSLYIGCYPDVAELLETSESPAPAGKVATGKAVSGNAARPRPGTVKSPVVVDWDRNHPVTRFIAFADLAIEESLAFPRGRGYRSLIDAGEQSIAGTVTVPVEGKLPASVLVLGFDVLKSNWPWLHSFPIFFGNAIAWLGEAAGSEARPRYRTGDVLTFYPAGRKLEAAVFRDPGGRDHPASPERTGELSFAGTDLPGIYELRAGGEVLETYPVSLLSAAESSVAPRKEIRFGGQVVASAAATLKTQDLWKWFALAALAFVCLEWWIWNRRVI